MASGVLPMFSTCFLSLQPKVVGGCFLEGELSSWKTLVEGDGREAFAASICD